MSLLLGHDKPTSHSRRLVSLTKVVSGIPIRHNNVSSGLQIQFQILTWITMAQAMFRGCCVNQIPLHLEAISPVCLTALCFHADILQTLGLLFSAW